MKKRQRLILFDIDGTLTHGIPASINFADRYMHAIHKAYGVKLSIDPRTWSYEGWVDRATVWDLVKNHISRQMYLSKFDQFALEAEAFMRTHVGTQKVSAVFPGAKGLLARLFKTDHRLGLITGNVEKVAWWKMEHTGLKKYFEFGLFGEEAENRVELAELVFAKAEMHLGKRFLPQEIVIVGDTIHDIKCGKSIGAITIGVTTGSDRQKSNYEILKKEEADLVVDSLMDSQVLEFLGIK